jgi:hypothetical protein
MTQARSISTSRTLLLAQAITIRLLPVKSSAPPTTTSTRPSAKTRPPSARTGPPGPEIPASTVVANMPPSPMKAPPSTARANSVTASRRVLAAPISSALRAISGGSNASTRPASARGAGSHAGFGFSAPWACSPGLMGPEGCRCMRLAPRSLHWLEKGSAWEDVDRRATASSAPA